MALTNLLYSTIWTDRRWTRLRRPRSRLFKLLMESDRRRSLSWPRPETRPGAWPSTDRIARSSPSPGTLRLDVSFSFTAESFLCSTKVNRSKRIRRIPDFIVKSIFQRNVRTTGRRMSTRGCNSPSTSARTWASSRLATPSSASPAGGRAPVPPTLWGSCKPPIPLSRVFFLFLFFV